MYTEFGESVVIAFEKLNGYTKASRMTGVQIFMEDVNGIDKKW